MIISINWWKVHKHKSAIEWKKNERKNNFGIKYWKRNTVTEILKGWLTWKKNQNLKKYLSLSFHSELKTSNKIVFLIREVLRYRPKKLDKTKNKRLVFLYIILMTIVSNVGDQSRGWPECSLFDSNYTKVSGRALHLSLVALLYPWSVPYNAEC